VQFNSTNRTRLELSLSFFERQTRCRIFLLHVVYQDSNKKRGVKQEECDDGRPLAIPPALLCCFVRRRDDYDNMY
jgi:hypothetical protein